VGNSRKLKGVPVLSLNFRSQQPHPKTPYPRMVFCLSSLAELDEQCGHACDIRASSLVTIRAYPARVLSPQF